MTLPYYKWNKLIPYFSKEDGAQVVRDVALSLERAPPIRAESKPAPVPSPPKPKRQPGDGIKQMMDLYDRYKTWSKTPAPPKSPKPTPSTDSTVPPFDIQQIPGAMRKLHLPVAAELMERWFMGRLNNPGTQLMRLQKKIRMANLINLICTTRQP